MKRKLLVALGAMVLGFGVIMGMLFPAGSSPMAARKTALAMRGRNLFALMSDAGLWGRRELFVVPSNDCRQSLLIANVLRIHCRHEDVHNIFDKNGSLWQFALIDCEKVGEGFPVVISANFNANNLGNYATGDLLPIGRESGAERSLLDDHAIVVVRKNGTSQIISANHLTKQTLFMGEKSDGVHYCSIAPWKGLKGGGGQSARPAANRSDSKFNPADDE